MKVIVCGAGQVGQEANEACQRQLGACLLTAEEMAAGRGAWRKIPDPLTHSWGADQHHDHDQELDQSEAGTLVLCEAHLAAQCPWIRHEAERLQLGQPNIGGVAVTALNAVRAQTQQFNATIQVFIQIR